MQRLSSFLIGCGFGLIGMSLLYDQWGIERYERTVREIARLDNQFLPQIDAFFQVRQLIAYLLIGCSFVTMNRIALLYVFTIPLLLFYGLLNYNAILYRSERFGGDNTISGLLFYVAVSAAIIDGVIKYQDKATKEKSKMGKSKVEKSKQA